MLKAIIFDMDGVLINTEPLHFEVWKRVFQNRGIEVSYEVYKDCIGSTAKYLLELIRKNYGVDFEDDDIRREAAQMKESIIKERGFPEISGVKEMLERLDSAGIQMAVASSSAEKYIQEAMKTLGIESFFQVLCSGENVKNPKPAPDVFLKAASEMNLRPEECLVIEDSTNGCLAAKNAGMKCIGFRNPDSGNQDLSTAALTIEKWEELDDELIGRLLHMDE